LSGSDNLSRAIAWAAETMKKDGLENVRTEKVMVPKWTRGRESAEIIDPPRHPLTILGLGGTVATPPGGLEGEVLVVDSFNELRMRAADARGRIVPVQPALYQLRRYGQLPHWKCTCRSAGCRGRRIRALGRSGRSANGAHRQRGVPVRFAVDPCRRHIR
jgi:carboxypeptidase Q